MIRSCVLAKQWSAELQFILLKKKKKILCKLSYGEKVFVQTRFYSNNHFFSGACIQWGQYCVISLLSLDSKFIHWWVQSHKQYHSTSQFIPISCLRVSFPPYNRPSSQPLVSCSAVCIEYPLVTSLYFRGLLNYIHWTQSIFPLSILLSKAIDLYCAFLRIIWGLLKNCVFYGGREITLCPIPNSEDQWITPFSFALSSFLPIRGVMYLPGNRNSVFPERWALWKNWILKRFKAQWMVLNSTAPAFGNGPAELLAIVKLS